MRCGALDAPHPSRKRRLSAGWSMSSLPTPSPPCSLRALSTSCPARAARPWVRPYPSIALPPVRLPVPILRATRPPHAPPSPLRVCLLHTQPSPCPLVCDCLAAYLAAGPIMKSGLVDCLGFIGGTRGCDALILQHPAPHRLKVQPPPRNRPDASPHRDFFQPADALPPSLRLSWPPVRRCPCRCLRSSRARTWAS